MRKYFILLMLAVSGCISAQTAQQVLTDAGNAFRDNKYLSMEVAVYNYENSTSTGVLLGIGIMRKSPEGYYSKFMEDEMISNKHCTVILNHGARSMMCFSGEKQKRKNNNVMVAPDSMVNPNDSLVYMGIVNAEKHVVIYHKNSYFLRTEMFLSVATSLPSRIVYYHAPANDDFTTDAYKTELLYQKISFEEPEESLFSEEKYVEKKNGTWISTPAYKNYKLTVSETPEQ